MSAKDAYKLAKPLMSTDYCEARRRAIALYKAFYRLMPYIPRYYDIAKSEEDCRCKLRELFYLNACVTDVRVIDLLIIKGHMELNELKYTWQQKGHVLANWNPTAEPKPTDFISKFIAGID